MSNNVKLNYSIMPFTYLYKTKDGTSGNISFTLKSVRRNSITKFYVELESEGYVEMNASLHNGSINKVSVVKQDTTFAFAFSYTKTTITFYAKSWSSITLIDNGGNNWV